MSNIKNEPEHIKNHKIRSELDIIAETIIASTNMDSGYNLEVEVFWSAMNYLKQTPEATIEEACEYGINEWIK